jgi:hypothetical protein
MGIRNLADSVQASGHNINDTQVASPIYNDNKSCIKWSHNMTTTQICHMEMRKNVVRELVQDDLLKVVHISGCLNLAGIFTKETCNGAHFQHSCDSFMCALSDFLQQSLIAIHHSRQHDEPGHQQILPLNTSLLTSFAKGSYLLALCSSPLSRTLTAISYLSSAGCHIIRLLHRVVPLVLI